MESTSDDLDVPAIDDRRIVAAWVDAARPCSSSALISVASV
jgi:hypothetical protein